MTASPPLPADLELAWLGLDHVAGCVVLDEPRWSSAEHSWVFPVELTIENPSELVPARTRWYVVVDADDPAGDVEVYPAADSGLTATFPHQSYNRPAARGALWRRGKPCLTVPWNERRHRDRALPPADPELRMRWTLERAREWLARAARGELRAAGDPYELPDFAPQTTEELGAIVVPGVMDVRGWLERSTVEWGLLTSRTVRVGDDAERITLIRELRNAGPGSGAALPPWGTFLSDAPGTDRHGAWLWLPTPPVLRPWQSPQTWGELRGAFERAGLDLDRPLAQLCARFRGGSGALVLVGFPIPTRFAWPFEQVAWQALRLPPLTTRARLPARLRGRSLDVLDRNGPLAGPRPLQWLTTQTWSRDRLAVRGVADPTLQDLRVTLIGVGALGARLAELLVRAGVRRLHLIDPDTVEVGNLVRHTATLHALGRSKAVALRDALQAASPFAQVTAYHGALASSAHACAEQLGDAELVIDATASDAVLRILSTLPGDRPRLWSSLAVNRHAERLYCYLAHGPRFPQAGFDRAFRPWHEDDARRHSSALPWEGPGCWSPVFPARVDDITALVAVAVRELERLALNPAGSPSLRVYERRCNTDGTLLELRRRDAPDHAISDCSDSNPAQPCSGPDHASADRNRIARSNDSICTAS